MEEQGGIRDTQAQVDDQQGQSDLSLGRRLQAGASKRLKRFEKVVSALMGSLVHTCLDCLILTNSWKHYRDLSTRLV